MKRCRIVFNGMLADLHLHTYFSDGTYSPEELVGHACRVGLTAIALTDHDTVEGCERASAAAVAVGLQFIPGAELTAEFQGMELHLLAYCIDVRHARLLSETSKYQSIRQDRIREMVERLNRLDIPLNAQAVFDLANCQSPGRPHVARALVQAGFCGSLDEAFERFLKRNRPAWVPKTKVSARDAIALVHEAGGVAVMAHPGLNRSDEMIPALVEAGLDGIECFHTKHSTTAAERYLGMAERYKLLVTGGSDCHGMSKGKPLIGSVKVPFNLVEALRSKATEVRRSATSAGASTNPLPPSS